MLLTMLVATRWSVWLSIVFDQRSTFLHWSSKLRGSTTPALPVSFSRLILYDACPLLDSTNDTIVVSGVESSPVNAGTIHDEIKCE